MNITRPRRRGASGADVVVVAAPGLAISAALGMVTGLARRTSLPPLRCPGELRAKGREQ